MKCNVEQGWKLKSKEQKQKLQHSELYKDRSPLRSVTLHLASIHLTRLPSCYVLIVSQLHLPLRIGLSDGLHTLWIFTRIAGVKFTQEYLTGVRN